MTIVGEVLRGLQAAVVVVDAAGVIVSLSRGAERFLGLEAGVVEGQRLWEVLGAPEPSPSVEEGERTAYLPLMDRRVRIRQEVSDAGTVVVFRDAGREREPDGDAVRALMDALPVALVGLDRDDRVTHWNGAAERTFGWTAAEVLGRPYPLVPSGHAEEHRLILQDAFKGGEGFAGVETTRVRKDGTLVDVAVWTAPLGSGGVAVGVLLELTERKKLEQQLYQSQKMEAVGRLAGGVAHDFNNLITVVTGHSAMLLEQEGLGAEERRSVGEILEAGDRAAGLTRQLLAFSRRQVLRPRVIAIPDAIEDTGRMLRRLAGADVELIMDLHPETGHARVDPVQFQQVVMNLVVNARDAMPDGGVIEIRTSASRIDREMARTFSYPVRTGPYVLLEVSDTGVGMGAALQTRIFEPFFTTKAQGKGTGLGLSTVYGIVKQSGGYIWVESEVGVGTAFRVYLPRVDERAEAEDGGGRADEPGPRQAGGTILLVEDEDGVRKLARRILERDGYRVLEAAEGAAALREAGAYDGHIDLLLSDVVMPGLRGPEVLEQLRETRPGIQALFMSGYSEELLDPSAYLGRAVSFLPKPFTPDRLRVSVALAMGMVSGPAGETGAAGEREMERLLADLESGVADGPPVAAGALLARAGELCLTADQRERSLRYFGRAVDVYLGIGLDRAAEEVCLRILEVAPSVVRARRTLALVAIARNDAASAERWVGEYVRAAMEARQSQLAVRQLRTMASVCRDAGVRALLAHEIDLLGGALPPERPGQPVHGADPGGTAELADVEERRARAISAALAPPDTFVH